MVLTKGSKVQVRLLGSGDEWCVATVALVSENSISLALILDGAVHADGGRAVVAGMLPLLYQNGAYTGLTGDHYELRPDRGWAA